MFKYVIFSNWNTMQILAFVSFTLSQCDSLVVKGEFLLSIFFAVRELIEALYCPDIENKSIK